MQTKSLLIWIALASTAAVAALPVQAAPGAQPLSVLEQSSSVEKAAYRRCWWRDGRRHCRWYDGAPRVYGYRGHDYGVGSGRPEDYRVGSTEWWRAMDREDRGGFRR